MVVQTERQEDQEEQVQQIQLQVHQLQELEEEAEEFRLVQQHLGLQDQGDQVLVELEVREVQVELEQLIQDQVVEEVEELLV
jgi:hypothetical protein